MPTQPLDYHRPSGRHRAVRIVVYTGAALALAGAIYFIAVLVAIIVTVRTTHATPVAATQSVDGRYSVAWTQLTRFIDTNYSLTLRDELSASPPAELFLSPDEGPDDGMTSLVWSKDSSRVLVISNCVRVHESSPELVDGRKPYLLLTVADRSIQCNASQSILPTFTAADLADFTLPSPVRTSPTSAPTSAPTTVP